MSVSKPGGWVAHLLFPGLGFQRRVTDSGGVSVVLGDFGLRSSLFGSVTAQVIAVFSVAYNCNL